MMMNTVKENNKEYAVISAGGVEKDFTERMVMGNSIPWLVPVSKREFNGESSYYFDTTARRPFSDMFQSENDYMGKSEVEAICESIVGVTESVREYLLDIDDIELSPETYLFNTETERFEFMYIPGRKKDDEESVDFRGGVRLVWERVLKKFNRDADRDLIMKLYDMYQKMSADNFNPESVFKIKDEKENTEVLPEEVKSPVNIQDINAEDLYNEKEIEKIIEDDEKKVPDKKKKYAMYGGLAAAAIITLAVMV